MLKTSTENGANERVKVRLCGSHGAYEGSEQRRNEARDEFRSQVHEGEMDTLSDSRRAIQPRALRIRIANIGTPAGSNSRTVRADEGGECQRFFLNKLAILHGHIHPGTPLYSGTAKRVIGLLKEKTVAIPESVP